LSAKKTFTRTDARQADELRTLRITPDFMPYAEGSALIEVGQTRVICTATLEESVPRATQQRTQRETGRGGPSGRTHEIQRLIGRSLRAVCDLSRLGERTLTIDCDVLQADGGTRTASITGAYVAAALSCQRLQRKGVITKTPIKDQIAAVSVGIVEGVALLDLKYDEDSRAGVDMNVVCTGDGRFVEVQGTAEGEAFTRAEMDALLALASVGLSQLFTAQREAITRAAP
jgi:ribonuclease PH